MARTFKSNANKKLNAKKGNETYLLKREKQAERMKKYRETKSRLKSDEEKKEDRLVQAANKKKVGMKR